MGEQQDISPRCCDDATKTGLVVLRFSGEALYRSSGQDGHAPRWTADGHPVRFCPFCGSGLPGVRRKARLPKRHLPRLRRRLLLRHVRQTVE